MDRFKLNNYQTLGLMTYSIGSIIQGLTEDSIGLIVIFFGLFIFLISSKINIGFIISFVIIAIGYQFKIMHFANGNKIILLGMVGIIISGFFKFIYKAYKLELILIYISFIILIIGMYLKIAHLKYNMEFIYLGFLSITLSYANRFIKKSFKQFEDYNKMALVIFWSLSSVFNISHWFLGSVLSLITILILWSWLLTSFISYK